MKKPLFTAAAALVLLPLAACDSSSNTQNAEVLDPRGPDPMASQLANAAPVELPPALKASATLRCKDNSLIYVDFFSGDKQANLRTEKGGTPTKLTAPEAGQPLTAEGGYVLSGDAKAATITLPGKPAQACKA